MEFPFDTTRTAQAAALLLKLSGGTMTRMRLLKLLYIVDRELLAETGRTLTGDHAVAMNFGPVLSRTYSLIKGGRRVDQDWSRSIQSHGREVVLKADPGQHQLTRREVDKLQELFERFRSISTSGISAYTHGFAEYVQNFVPDTSTPIPWDDVLRGTGHEDLIPPYQARLEEQHVIDSIFGALNDPGR